VHQIGDIIAKELTPHIDGQYRTNTASANKSISGFSMGGAMAFYYALKYPELFGSVTAYAGTYHHWFYNDYSDVGEPLEKAVELYENIMSEPKYFEQDNVLYFIRQNAEKIRDNLQITIHVGTADPLICDNEILHLYLNSLDIPHEYRIFKGIEHELDKII
jgi:enterochelin esterase-like enzyme